jgi:hypothetical protein
MGLLDLDRAVQTIQNAGVSSRGLLDGDQTQGVLPDGRHIVRNGSNSERGPGYSTRFQMTEKIPGFGWMNLPTMYQGLQVSPDEAVDIIRKNNGVDPDTGNPLPVFPSLETAVTAAERMSKSTNFYLDQALSAPVGSAIRGGLLSPSKYME